MNIKKLGDSGYSFEDRVVEWSGYPLDKVKAVLDLVLALGWASYKFKVGRGLSQEVFQRKVHEKVQTIKNAIDVSGTGLKGSEVEDILWGIVMAYYYN